MMLVVPGCVLLSVVSKLFFPAHLEKEKGYRARGLHGHGVAHIIAC